MKRICLISLLLGLGVIYLFPQDSIVSIPNTAFLYALIEKDVDTNGDGLISYGEAEAITKLILKRYAGSRTISDMTGIEAFVNLVTLNCDYNRLTSLDVSKNKALRFLSIRNNLITSLDVSGNVALVELNCSGNPIFSLDISSNTALQRLWCDDNQLTSLDVSNNSALETLRCDDNQLTILDVSKNTALISLACNNNILENINLSNLTDLQGLSCNNNQLTSIDLSYNTNLETLSCANNQLSSLDVSSNINLEGYFYWGRDFPGLDCSNNLLTSLDISNNTSLYAIYLNDMPSLYEVCVWDGYHQKSWNCFDKCIYTYGSPNVYFTTECSGSGIDITTHSKLTIYPNPTNDLLTIETEQPDHYSINITSLNGQSVYSDKMEGTTHQIDLATFKKGVYFITIRSRDSITTRKIIKL